MVNSKDLIGFINQFINWEAFDPANNWELPRVTDNERFLKAEK